MEKRIPKVGEIWRIFDEGRPYEIIEINGTHVWVKLLAWREYDEITRGWLMTSILDDGDYPDEVTEVKRLIEEYD